jgi:predicted site-specific integrase-resolvase
MAKSGIERLPNVAAAYVRMSTEHQQYSTSNQMDVIREYAKRRRLEIAKIYSDACHLKRPRPPFMSLCVQTSRSFHSIRDIR